MKRLFQILIATAVILLGSVSEALAQSVVSGKIFETIDGQPSPLIGANVNIVTARNRSLAGTTADIDGNYNLKIPAGESNLTLVYSYIGMKSKRIKYTGQTNLNVTLESEAISLKNFEVVGTRRDRNDMGISQKEMVASTQKISMDDIVSTSPVSSIEDALQGQLGGVDILSGGGDPGAKGSIRIRGTSTLNTDAEPLIVIDGVPYTDEISEDYDWSNSNNEDLSALLNLSPTDIKSVEVLKDAAATAIWGSKGANGVLLIETKKGARGKTSFSFTSKFSAKFEPDEIPMLNGDQYTAYMQESIWNAANYKGLSNATNELNLLYNTPEIGYDPSYRYFDEYNQNTDWLSEVRKNAIKWENNFSMSGGGEKATYRLSLGYLTDGGTTIGTNLNRFNSSLRVDYNFSDKLRFGADFSFNNSDQDANYTKNVRSMAQSSMPNKSPYYIDDITGLRTGNYFSLNSDYEGQFDGDDHYNPVAMANESINNTNTREGKITFRANYEILPGFTWSAYASMKLKGSKNHKFLPQSAIGVPWTDGNANLSSDSYSNSYSLQTENKLIFIKNWQERHQLIATGVFRTSQSQSSSSAYTTSGNASSNLSDPINGSVVKGKGSGESEARSISGIIQANYTLLNRYVLQGTLSVEGNSAMGKDHRIGYFPAGGFSWNAQNEPFLKDVQWIDEIKLRASVGQTGGAPSGLSYFGTFSAISPGYMDMSAVEPKSMQLNSLKWQTTTDFNIGGDFGFFNNRLRFTVDVYHRYTKDLLQKKVTIPSSTGHAQLAYFNSGKMENYGWEARADVVFIQNKDWRLSGYVNLSHNTNKITELPVNMAQDAYTMKNGAYASIVEANRPVGSFYGYRYLGVYQNTEATYARDASGAIMKDLKGNPIIMKNGQYKAYPGDAIYEDVNHDGVINQYDIVYLGNSNPLLTGGAGLSLRWKDLTLSAFFYGNFGRKIINKARMNNESMYGKSNQSTSVLNRWKKEGDNTNIPRALYNIGYNYLGSDRFVESGSYVRLKTLTLSYNLPKKWLTKIGFQRMNVFATGYNLFTWTNYSGQDPEVKQPSSPLSFAEDNSTTPPSIEFACGFNLTF